jgi:hypothetical protein
MTMAMPHIILIPQRNIWQHQSTSRTNCIPHTIQDRIPNMTDTAVVIVTREHQALVPFRRRADRSHFLGIHGREVEGVNGGANEAAFGIGRTVPDSLRGNAFSVEG